MRYIKRLWIFNIIYWFFFLKRYYITIRFFILIWSYYCFFFFDLIKNTVLSFGTNIEGLLVLSSSKKVNGIIFSSFFSILFSFVSANVFLGIVSSSFSLFEDSFSFGEISLGVNGSGFAKLFYAWYPLKFHPY